MKINPKISPKVLSKVASKLGWNPAVGSAFPVVPNMADLNPAFYLNFPTGSVNAKISGGSPLADLTNYRDTENDNFASAVALNRKGNVKYYETDNTPRYVEGYYDALDYHQSRGLLIESAGENRNQNYCGVVGIDASVPVGEIEKDVDTPFGQCGTYVKWNNLDMKLSSQYTYNLQPATKYYISFYVLGGTKTHVGVSWVSGFGEFAKLLDTEIALVAGKWIRLETSITTLAVGEGWLNFNRNPAGESSLGDLTITGIQISEKSMESVVPSVELEPLVKGQGMDRNAEYLLYPDMTDNYDINQGTMGVSLEGINFAEMTSETNIFRLVSGANSISLKVQGDGSARIITTNDGVSFPFCTFDISGWTDKHELHTLIFTFDVGTLSQLYVDDGIAIAQSGNYLLPTAGGGTLDFNASTAVDMVIRRFALFDYILTGTDKDDLYTYLNEV